MKSAMELAMEKVDRLAEKEAKSLTLAQKNEIADLRKRAEAKIAEAQIMLDDRLSKFVGRPDYFAVSDEAKRNFNMEKTRIEEDLRQKIEKARES